LIDGNSVSGAEILASAFQESGRGKIVGQKSAGEVLNGITKSLSNGLKLYVAVRDYKTVKGIRLEGKGVTPDIVVPLIIEDFRKQHDAALEKALEILKNQ
jgi:carboxyl-terminal processing protease